MNESIFGDKLNIFIKAPEYVSDIAFKTLVNKIVLWSHLFELVNKVFEDNSDKGNQSNNE